tara:strand:+ start:256 stop:948 length:693 start_codon:yes stop_codon:yes gene_type:complete
MNTIQTNNSTHFGSRSPQLQIQQTFVNKDDKGLVIGKAAWKGQQEYPVQVGDSHPIDPIAMAYKWGYRFDVGGYIITEVDYIGLQSGPTNYYVEYTGTVQEEPIETHDKFVSDIGGTVSNPKNQAIFDAKTGEFIGFPGNAPNDLGGVKGYLSPSITARVTYYAYGPKKGNINDLGNKSNPPVNLPKHQSGANWLLVGVSFREFATITVQVTEEYMLSGRKGWNDLIYTS